MSRCERYIAACAAVLAVSSAQELSAQAPPILPSTRVVQAGPASLYPTIALRNVGTDSNVYNEGATPREDFTYSVTPRLYAVVPIASTRFVGTGTGDFIYYRTYKDQQSINGYLEGRYEVLESRIRPFAVTSLSTHRERQDLEIDLRARQTQTTITLGSDVALTAATSLTGWVRREHTAWDRNDQYLSVSLAEQLNFTADLAAVGVRFRLTPLTSLIAVAEIQRDRFELSPDRDADSLRVAPSMEFANGGAISGQLRAGYRSFRPLNPALSRYSGFTASAGLRYEVVDLTRVYIDGGRDVKYSFDPLQPYYLESGVRLKVIQRVIGPIEGVAIVERWQLRHQRIGGSSFDGRHEDTTTLGGGIGFRFREQMELTLTIDRTERTSSQPGRDYERRRVLASISYGL